MQNTQAGEASRVAQALSQLVMYDVVRCVCSLSVAQLALCYITPNQESCKECQEVVMYMKH